MALAKLANSLSFNLLKKKLRYVGYMINLAVDAFLIGGDLVNLDKNIRRKQWKMKKLKLWYKQKLIGKLYYIVIYITCLSFQKNWF